MVGVDVMNPPLKVPRRRTGTTEEQVLEKLNWFTEMWAEERTSFLEAREEVAELQERVDRQDHMIRSLEDTIADLRKEVAGLTKPRRNPRRQSKNYKKTSA